MHLFFLGSLVLTCLLALVCALFIECPIVELARFMFKKRREIPVAKNYTLDSVEESTINYTEED